MKCHRITKVINKTLLKNSNIWHDLISTCCCCSRTIIETDKSCFRNVTAYGMSRLQGKDWKTTPTGEVVPSKDVKEGDVRTKLKFFSSLTITKPNCKKMERISELIVKVMSTMYDNEMFHLDQSGSKSWHPSLHCKTLFEREWVVEWIGRDSCLIMYSASKHRSQAPHNYCVALPHASATNIS